MRSKPEHNVDGMLEKELYEVRREERGLTRKRKLGHLKELTSIERAEIVRLYTKDHLP